MNLAVLAGHNADAALTLTFRVRDADGDHVSNGAAPLAANSDAQVVGGGFPLIVTTALTAAVSGGTGGTPCEFRGNYSQIAIPPGMLRPVIALTAAYQVIPVVPANGVTVGYRTVPIYDQTNQGTIVFNGDSAPCTLQFRLTRAAQTFSWNGSATAVGARAAPIPVLALLAGDVFECRLAAPPVIAGSVLLRALYVPSVAAV